MAFDQAEVDERKVPFACRKDVPRLRVDLERATVKHLMPERPHVGLHERPAVDLPGAHLVGVVDGHAVDRLDREDAPARQLPVHLRNDDAERPQPLAKRFGRLSLEVQIDLSAQRFVGFGQERPQVDLREARENPEETAHHREVDRGAALRTGVLNFHDHLLARLPRREVRLRRRAPCDRCLVELGEELERSHAELRPDDARDHRIFDRGSRAAQRPELFDVLVRQDMALRARDPAHFRRDAAEAQDGFSESPSIGAVGTRRFFRRHSPPQKPGTQKDPQIRERDRGHHPIQSREMRGRRAALLAAQIAIERAVGAVETRHERVDDRPQDLARDRAVFVEQLAELIARQVDADDFALRAHGRSDG